MSLFSSVCDLYDHISFEKQYPLYPDNKYSPLVSDEMECFKLFKEKTGGVMYQHKLLKLTEWNIDAEIKKQDNPSILSKVEHKSTVVDRRCRDGTKEVTTYTYRYFGKEYHSLTDLNKKHYYTTVKIEFDDLLDIIPYYPYAIAACCYTDGKETIVLANESEVDTEERRCLEGGINGSAYIYRHNLQKHYLDVIKRYYSDDYDGTQKYFN